MIVSSKWARWVKVSILAGLAAGCVAEKPLVSTSPTVGNGWAEAPIEKASAPPRSLFNTGTTDDLAHSVAERLVELGDGVVVGEAKGNVRADFHQNDSGDIALNVVNADIRDVIRLILEDALGANYAVDPAITGTISVRTSRPIPAEDALATLGSILSLNDAALIDVDGFYKVVPIEQAATSGGKPLGRREGRGRGLSSSVQVAPLSYADASQLGELLQPFVGDKSRVQVDAARNSLLLIGPPEQIATMTDLVDMFDVDWMRGLSFGLFPLKAVGAEQLASELDQVLGDPNIGSLEGGVRLVPVERLRALIVISTQAQSLGRVEKWIERLDKAGEGQGKQVYVYEVQNSRATDLASVLGELFNIKSTSVGEDALLAPGLEPITLSSSSAAFGTTDEDDGAAANKRDGRRGSGSKPRGIVREFGGQSLTTGNEDSQTRIVADETNNALLTRATAEEYQEIRAALDELDRQPIQVLLEATIAEVTLRDELSYGVQWFFGSDDVDVRLSEFSDGTVSQLFPGFSGLLSRGDVRAVLNALDSVSEVNVISSPQILVLDNQTAQLEVGDEVPIVTQQAEGIDTPDARIVNTVEQRQTGVILNVTPRVNANGHIVLDIRQEVSDVVRTTTSGIDSPTIAQRRIATSVAVASEETIVLGGLIQDDVEEIESGVPILRDIPVLGTLFGATTQTSSRTELLVLITPKVLTNQRDAVAATNELRRRFQSLEPLQAKINRDYQDDRPIEMAEVPAPVLLQLAAAATAKEAWGTWHRLVQDHADDLQDLRPWVVALDGGESDPFSLQVGPFDHSEQGNELCSLLMDEHTSCHVLEAGD